jgi:hypothetical protein
MPDVLGLFPIPSGSDPDCNTSSLKLLAESLTDDLVNKTDVPARLPSQFHDDIPIGAACRILESLGDEISIARRSMLLPRWFSPGDPYNQAAVQRVQALAQQRNRAEVSQAEPMEYRDQYAIGIPNYTGDGWWQNDEQY